MATLLMEADRVQSIVRELHDAAASLERMSIELNNAEAGHDAIRAVEWAVVQRGTIAFVGEIEMLELMRYDHATCEEIEPLADGGLIVLGTDRERGFTEDRWRAHGVPLLVRSLAGPETALERARIELAARQERAARRVAGLAPAGSELEAVKAAPAELPAAERQPEP